MSALVTSRTSEDVLLNLLAVCTHGLQQAIEVIDHGGLILHERDAKVFEESMNLHLRSFLELAGYYQGCGEMMYKIRHKVHYITHMISDVVAYRLNPKIFNTCGEESFLGKLKAIGIRCHGGTMTFRIYQRYLLVLALALQEHRVSAATLS